jgi:2-polyprenyl-6-methoxyphenol hydroxylase-like FAD-dependent oxidoreductase
VLAELVGLADQGVPRDAPARGVGDHRLRLRHHDRQVLAAYENTRRPRITRMLKAGQDNRARKKAAGRLRRHTTDAVMSFGLKHFYEKATGWLYAYDVGELPVRA